MDKIIVINGSGNSGKDEVVKLLSNELRKKHYIVYNVSTVDPIRDAMNALSINHEDRKGDTNIRDFMSKMKDLWTEYFDGSFKYIKTKYEVFKRAKITTGLPFIMFVHSREPEEIQRFVDFFGSECTTVLVKSDKRAGLITTNHADANVEKFNYDYIIDNNGTLEDLSIMIDNYFKFINF